jgi:hypothetical protein
VGWQKDAAAGFRAIEALELTLEEGGSSPFPLACPLAKSCFRIYPSIFMGHSIKIEGLMGLPEAEIEPKITPIWSGVDGHGVSWSKKCPLL